MPDPTTCSHLSLCTQVVHACDWSSHLGVLLNIEERLLTNPRLRFKLGLGSDVSQKGG